MWDTLCVEIQKAGKVLTIGVAFDWQKSDELPYIEGNDEIIDYIITEKEVYTCNPSDK